MDETAQGGGMDETTQPRGAQDSLDMLREQTRAWWTEALAGQAVQSHPVHGTNVRAHLEGRTLVLSGRVPSERDHLEVTREAQHLKRGHGIRDIRDELVVERTDAEREGLLIQTLMSIFETEEQAGFAAGYLEGHAAFTAEMIHVLTPDHREHAVAVLHALLPDAFWRDAEEELRAGRALLVVTVDEVDAFTARELLAEETPSLRTVVLPPEPAGNADRAEAALRDTVRATKSPMSERSERTRRETRSRERAAHEH